MRNRKDAREEKCCSAGRQKEKQKRQMIRTLTVTNCWYSRSQTTDKHYSPTRSWFNKHMGMRRGQKHVIANYSTEMVR